MAGWCWQTPNNQTEGNCTMTMTIAALAAEYGMQPVELVALAESIARQVSA